MVQDKSGGKTPKSDRFQVKLEPADKDAFFKALKDFISSQADIYTKKHYSEAKDLKGLIVKEYRSKFNFLMSRMAPRSVRRLEQLGRQVRDSPKYSDIIKIIGGQ